MDNCKECNQPMDHSVKHVIAYVDDKPVYSQLCKGCLKKRYEEMWKNYHESMEKK